jgi:hypothetical protein
MPPALLTTAVVAYAVAMAYVESAVVVYLRAALGAATGEVFPLDLSTEAGALGLIELGREAATMVMIAGVAWVVGRTGLERLAWAAVVFGIWDIGYYAWLWAVSGWPTSLDTWDLLFLIPVPWAGPVWAPVAVSLALVTFGLLMAGRCRRADTARITPLQLVVLISAGLVVIVSFVLNASVILAGGIPTSFPWPVFAAGMLVGVVTGVWVLRTAETPDARTSAGES